MPDDIKLPPPFATLHDDGYWTMPRGAEFDKSNRAGWRREVYTADQLRAAVLAEQGDQAVLELHEVDGVTVLYSPVFGYAYVNEAGPGVGDSLVIDSGEADSPEHAARVWRGETEAAE